MRLLIDRFEKVPSHNQWGVVHWSAPASLEALPLTRRAAGASIGLCDIFASCPLSVEQNWKFLFFITGVASCTGMLQPLWRPSSRKAAGASVEDLDESSCIVGQNVNPEQRMLVN